MLALHPSAPLDVHPPKRRPGRAALAALQGERARRPCLCLGRAAAQLPAPVRQPCRVCLGRVCLGRATVQMWVPPKQPCCLELFRRAGRLGARILQRLRVSGFGVSSVEARVLRAGVLRCAPSPPSPPPHTNTRAHLCQQHHVRAAGLEQLEQLVPLRGRGVKGEDALVKVSV